MTKVFSDVHYFMKACGQNPPAQPSPDSDLSALYAELIREEYNEFLESANDTERLDACFDMIWVIVGYMHSRGWDTEASWDEGAKSNLSKVDPVTGKCLRREDGKILKPKDWQPPDFSKFV